MYRDFGKGSKGYESNSGSDDNFGGSPEKGDDTNQHVNAMTKGESNILVSIQ